MSNIKKAIVFLAGISLYASAHAVPVFYSGTGNYYEYVSDSVLSTEAQAAAAANSYLGTTGYLATILDAGENTFITNLISGPAWIGLSDAAVEGEWRWVDGPEAGDLAVYTNWSAGEPNDYIAGKTIHKSEQTVRGMITVYRTSPLIAMATSWSILQSPLRQHWPCSVWA